MGTLGSSVERYQGMVVGQRGLWPLLRYELLTGLLGPLPGAPGIVLRSTLYRRLLGTAAKGVAIGRSVTLRGPGRIHLERGVALDDYVELTTREEGSGIRIGAGSLIARGAILHARGGTIELGEESSIGSHCRIGTTSRISIGRHALFAAGCFVGGENHPIDDPTTPMVKQRTESRGGVTIGDDVWLGLRATVLDGVSIGRGAVVGAHSLVMEDVPEMAIVAGTPARVIRYREGHEASTASLQEPDAP